MPRLFLHSGAPFLASALLFLTAVPASGDIVLDFQAVLAARGSDVPFFDPIHTQGFTLTSTNPPTGFSAGFEAHGPGSIFYAGEVGIVAFAPATSPPDNIIQLTQDGGKPFNLLSIDLARNFPFDPAPTVTFTGVKAGGGTVTESFTVTTPSGTSAFQTFSFTGFTDLTSVSFGQPQLSDGLNQFSMIRVAPTAVPEPSTLILIATGGATFLASRAMRPRSGKRGIDPRHQSTTEPSSAS
jgi:hypothetical protein